MKHQQRPQGFVAASAAQFRPDHAAGDDTPGNETEDDADKKAGLRPHDRSSDRPLVSVPATSRVTATLSLRPALIDAWFYANPAQVLPSHTLV
jgi:hypothetical protein